MTLKNDINTEGRVAYQNGVFRLDNPYRAGTMCAVWWEEGWLDIWAAEYDDYMRENPL